MNRASSTSLNAKSKTQVIFPLNVLKPLKPRNISRLKKYETKDDISNRTESTEKQLDLESLLEESVKYINAEKKPSVPFYLHKPMSDEDSIDNDSDSECEEYASEHANLKVTKETKIRSKKVSMTAGNGSWKPVLIDTTLNPNLVGGPFAGPPNSKKESLDVVNERKRSLNRDHKMTKSSKDHSIKSRLKYESPLCQSKQVKNGRSKSRSPPLVIPSGFLNIFDGDEKYKCPILNPLSSEEKIMSSPRGHRSAAAYMKPNVSKHKFRPEDVDEAVQIKINERIRSMEKLKKQHEVNKATSQKIRESLFGNKQY